MPQPNGPTVQLRVTGITVDSAGDSMVTVDANHPLAGKTLIFDLTLVGLQKGDGDQGGEQSTQ
jgi:FKBP-type peptidyl-prolyl cis-trans isomerase 2